MKKIVCIMITLMLLMIAFVFTASADVGDYDFYESEPNNVLSAANNIHRDYTVSGNITKWFDNDYYSFTVKSSTDVSIYCQSEYSSIEVSLYNSSGNSIASGVSAYKEGYHYDTITKYLSSGTYYIVVSQNGAAEEIPYLFYIDYEDSSFSSSENTTSHKHNYTSKRVEPTCTAEGYYEYTCYSCGDSYKTSWISKTDHKESDWIVVKVGSCNTEYGEESIKQKKCLDCDKVIDTQYYHEDHELSDWIIADYSIVCGYIATRYKECLNCGIKVLEEKVPYDHTESEEWYYDEYPTCISMGYRYKKCTECGDPINSQMLNPTEHSWVEATCTTPITCSVCNLTYGDAAEHIEITIPAKAATYTSTGLTEGKKCSECGTVTVKQKKLAKKKLKKVTLSSVKSTKAKQASVNWKTVSDSTGYIVEYSTSKKFTKKTTKKVTVKKAKSKKTTLKKLKSGKKYYIRIRAYKTVGKKTVYGAYSSVKTVKVK